LIAVAVRVEATGDVTVHVASVSDWSTGSYVALPLDELGSDYYVISYRSTNETAAYRSQLCVVSQADNTLVRLRLAASGASSLRPVDVGIDITDNIHQTTATVLLNKYQTFQVNKENTEL